MNLFDKKVSNAIYKNNSVHLQCNVIKKALCCSALLIILVQRLYLVQTAQIMHFTKNEQTCQCLIVSRKHKTSHGALSLIIEARYSWHSAAKSS